MKQIAELILYSHAVIASLVVWLYLLKETPTTTFMKVVKHAGITYMVCNTAVALYNMISIYNSIK